MHLRRRAITAWVFALTAFTMAGDPAAQTLDRIYIVDEIEVAEEAGNAVDARNLAMEIGKRQGLIELLERLTSPRDHERLPTFEGVEIDRYVQSFDVVSEKVASTSYEAELAVTYLPEPVQGTLRGLGIPYALRASDPVLIVPAIRDEQGFTVWAETDAWAQAWRRQAQEPGLLTIRLPFGDAEDRSLLSGSDIAAGRLSGLDSLRTRYDADEAVLAIANVSDARAVLESPLNEAPAALGSPLQPPTIEQPRQIHVEAVSFRNAPEVILSENVEAFPEAEDEEPPNLYGLAAAAVTATLEAVWKEENIVRTDVVTTANVEAPLSSLRQWISLRDAIDDTPVVRTMRIASLERDLARLTLDYVGTEERLKQSLERRGQLLINTASGFRLVPATSQSRPVLLPSPIEETPLLPQGENQPVPLEPPASPPASETTTPPSAG